jgi:Ca2+-binding RTX toxin-like protein
MNIIQGNGKINVTHIDDHIIGSNMVDFIEGYDGDDEIEGRGGSDRIYGGRGDDRISGGNGDDFIDGQNGNDIIFGDDGLDNIAGGDGDDYLFGGTNGPNAGIPNGPIETLNGEDGHDILVGGQGDDRLVGGDDTGSGDDDDYLVGTDYEAGGTGEQDYLRGGRGADTFVLGEVKSALEQEDLRRDELTGQTAHQKVYYLDGGWNNGNDSYAVIEDFRPNQGDTLQLINPDYLNSPYQGFQQSYVVGPSPIPGIQGSAIYLSSNYVFIPDDLIAIVQFGGNPDRTINLRSDYMSYVGEPYPPFEFELPHPFPIEKPTFPVVVGEIVG